MTTTAKRRVIDLKSKPKSVQRLAKLVLGIKDDCGSMEKLGRVLNMSGANVQKYCEGNIDSVEAIQVGNLKKLADYLNWTIDGLLEYLENGVSPERIIKNNGIDTLSPEDKIALIFELSKSLIAQERKIMQQPPEERLDLDDRQRLKLSFLYNASISKSGEEEMDIIRKSGISSQRLELIANGDRGAEIFMSDLNKLAPFCFHPQKWIGLRPNPLSETRMESGEELLRAIMNSSPTAK